jgi:hypothetical protein
MAQVTLRKFFSGVPQIRELDGDSKKIYEHKRKRGFIDSWSKNFDGLQDKNFLRVTCAILAPNSGTESEILSRHLREYDKFYKYGGLMRISKIFLLGNLSINVPYKILKA